MDGPSICRMNFGSISTARPSLLLSSTFTSTSGASRQALSILKRSKKKEDTCLLSIPDMYINSDAE